MSDKSKTIALYTRISTTQQDTASQMPDLQRWVAANGGNVVWFTDAVTGKTMERPGWQRLMDAVRLGEVSSVVCWRLDRLGRTAKGLTALFDELLTRKVNLVSLKDGIDLLTPAGRLMAHVLASVAQYETEVRAERVKAGQLVAIAKGKRWGGSQKGKETSLRAKPEQIEAIAALKAHGKGVSAIARATGLTRTTVYSYLAAEAV